MHHNFSHSEDIVGTNNVNEKELSQQTNDYVIFEPRKVQGLDDSIFQVE